MRMRDWSSDVCSSDLVGHGDGRVGGADVGGEHEPGARVEGELRRRPTAGGDGLGDRGDEPNAHQLIDAGGDAGSGEAGGLRQFVRNSVVWGKSVSVRVDLCDGGTLNKKKCTTQ